MPKRFLEDMVLAKRERLKTEEKKRGGETFIVETREKVEVKKVEVGHLKSRSRYMLWFVAFVSVVFCFFAFTFLFSKAEVTINPKIKDIVLNKNLSANKDSNTSDLSFRLMVISGEENKTIEATTEKDVADKAIGTILIFNAFNSSVQTLSIDTRLEGSNGKIYKTQTKIIVPGMSKNGTPGSVEVGIYGEKAGEEYNSDPLDFKIFGFKGSSKYSKFYGRSKGAITGGFKGKAPAVADADKMEAISELKASLKVSLLQKSADYPNEFVLFKNAIFFDINDSNVLFTTKDKNLIITLKGTLYGFLFNEQKLTKKIAIDNIDKYDGSDVYISNIKDLIFSLSAPAGIVNKDNVLFDNIENIDFNLSGPAKIVWKLDENKFIDDLLGKSKKDFNQVLSQYPNIESAILKLRFPWMQSVPNKKEDVKIIVNYPK